MNNDKILQMTVTGEPIQPIRLYYHLRNKERLVSCLKRLRCFDFDPEYDRWAWLYAYEAKSLHLPPYRYSSIPRKLRPIVIGSIFMRERELVADFRSFQRAIEAVKFLDKRIKRETAKLTSAAVYCYLHEMEYGQQP